MHGTPEVYTPFDGSACAFDLSRWHDGAGCLCVVFAASGHSHGVIFCTTCRVAADIEAVGSRCTFNSSGISLAEAQEAAAKGRKP